MFTTGRVGGWYSYPLILEVGQSGWEGIVGGHSNIAWTDRLSNACICLATWPPQFFGLVRLLCSILWLL